jgi:hypothetical protein
MGKSVVTGRIIGPVVRDEAWAQEFCTFYGSDRVMRPFSKEQINTIKDALAGGKLLHQITCPNCHESTLRWYQQIYSGPMRTVLLGYQWCPNCRSYLGSTGPVPPGYNRTDPIASDPTRKAALDGVHQVNEMLRILDRFWDEGILPQD